VKREQRIKDDNELAKPRKLGTLLPWEINAMNQNMPSLESENKIVEAERIKREEEEKKRKEEEDSKEIQRVYQQEIKRQMDLIEKQTLEHEIKQREEREKEDRLERERIEREHNAPSENSTLLAPIEEAEEEVILFVQGKPVRSSDITEDVLHEMTPEEFEQYERLVAEHREE